MRWFFVTFGVVTGVFFLSFIAWIVTRMLHLDAANHWVGRIMVWDLYAIGVVVAYVAFVGAWHTWEKLTGRMESEQDEPKG